jgi:hypothetical protein
MKRGFVHLLVRMIRAEMAGSAGLRVSGLFQGKPVGGVAAITSLLDDMATLAEGGADLLRNGKVFSLNPHSIKPDRMAALPELCKLLLVAFSTFFRKDHSFLFRGCLMVDVAGHTMDTLLGMFRFHPGLEKPRRDSLVTFHAKSGVHLGGLLGGSTNASNS